MKRSIISSVLLLLGMALLTSCAKTTGPVDNAPTSSPTPTTTGPVDKK